MSKAIDLRGQRFGRLVAIRNINKKNNNRNFYWKCRCDCGNKIEVPTASLRNGNTKSCGCLHKDIVTESGSKLGNKYINNAQNVLNEKYRVEDTSICNLTEKKSKNNTSGVKGVTWDKQTSKWRAQIMFQGKGITLGRYEKLEDATKARKQAEEELFHPIIEEYKNISKE